MFPQDEIIDKRLPVHPLHDCAELTTWQDYRGIRRYFLSHAIPSQPESTGESNSFSEGLMGEDESCEPTESIQETVGSGNGEDEIPF